ncbi:TPA: thioesterase family protein [Staphylococcus aureus]|nr:thioesterase family protein [Staphylococcus aureus]HCY6666020.1 thioesterase family protein [Staphylococcus aureus]
MVIITQLFTHTQTVTSEFIDHNNHMHDANYNITFSDVVNRFNYSHGLSLKERENLAYTLFTLEEHTTYLSELSLGDVFTVTLYIYDYDYKRLHLFLTLTKEDGTLASTNEVMMMGINQHTRRSDAFPESFSTQIAHYYKNQPTITWPEQLGHKIAIPHKGALK